MVNQQNKLLEELYIYSANVNIFIEYQYKSFHFIFIQRILKPNLSILQIYLLQPTMTTQLQDTIIQVVGWVYFFAWSSSFYGQIYTNYKLKNVEGMNLDFVVMNLTGFLFYSIYNTYGYFISNEQTGRVDLNDVFFSYHALFATLVTVSQIFMYPKTNNKVHLPTVILLILMWGTVAIYGTLTMQTKTINTEPNLGVISFLGYYKLAISSLKYLPQFYWNYKRKSTAGWSIFNILLDLTGGLLSFGQMGLQALFGQDVSINIVKLVLGIMVVFYDIGFVIQHYVIYPQKKQPKNQQVTQTPYRTLGTQNSITGQPQRKTEARNESVEYSQLSRQVQPGQQQTKE